MRQEMTDLSKCHELIKVIEKIRDRRENKLEKNHFDLFARYFKDICKAKEEGRFIVARGLFTPPEIFNAMDIASYPYHLIAMPLTYVLKLHEEVFGAAGSVGVTPEICGGHIAIPGVALKGWMPKPDFIAWDYGPCDNSAKTGELLMEIFGVPGFFLDRPYRYEDEEIRYYADQLEEMVSVLENMTGHSMNWSKLKEEIKLTAEIVALRKEIYEMRKAVPCPVSMRWSIYLTFAGNCYPGKQEGVDFSKLMRDEIKKLRDLGKGPIPKENHRIMFLGWPSIYSGELLDWMQLEKGISLVGDPGYAHYTALEPDYNEPIKSIASGYRSHFI